MCVFAFGVFVFVVCIFLVRFVVSYFCSLCVFIVVVLGCYFCCCLCYCALLVFVVVCIMCLICFLFVFVLLLQSLCCLFCVVGFCCLLFAVFLISIIRIMIIIMDSCSSSFQKNMRFCDLLLFFIGYTLAFASCDCKSCDFLTAKFNIFMSFQYA